MILYWQIVRYLRKFSFVQLNRITINLTQRIHTEWKMWKRKKLGFWATILFVESRNRKNCGFSPRIYTLYRINLYENIHVRWLIVDVVRSFFLSRPRIHSLGSKEGTRTSSFDALQNYRRHFRMKIDTVVKNSDEIEFGNWRMFFYWNYLKIIYWKLYKMRTKFILSLSTNHLIARA